MVMLLLTGGLLNAVQTTMYALAAHVYPTEIRSTGVGFAVAFGRIGNVLAGYVGAYALDQGGPPGYFTSWLILMGIVFLSLPRCAAMCRERRVFPLALLRARTDIPAASWRRTCQAGHNKRLGHARVPSVGFSDRERVEEQQEI